MGQRLGNLAALIERWETFFHQFMGYIFHTDAGRRIRWQFIRRMLFRTITYTLACVPVMIVLWYYHLFLGDSPAVNVTVALLILDLAFGTAFLRTMYAYRHRVRSVMGLNFEEGLAASLEENENVPASPLETEVTDDLEVAEGGEEEEEPSALGESFSEPEEPQIARRIYKCKSCGKHISMPANVPMMDLHCSCGGKMRAL